MPLDENHNSKSSSDLLAPETILQSRYRVVRHLGKGGMGAVYEAVDLRLGNTVALKQALTSDEQLWRQFEREARLLAQLDHPVLPRVTDYFTEGNRAFFVMQFIEGKDLSEIIAQQVSPFPRNAVIAWADQVLDALIYLHSHDRQIIHRDIKPHNLKVKPGGRIALLDFGLAKTRASDVSESRSCTSVFGYTPRYAPLEQIQDLGTSPQSDIYALGATLYHLLTGIKPPDALARAAALISSQPNPLKPAHEINSAVGLQLSTILSRAMAQNPNDRYPSAVEFRKALARVGRIDNSTAHVRTRPCPKRESELGEVAETTVVLADELATAYKSWRKEREAENQTRGPLFGEVLGIASAPVQFTDAPVHHREVGIGRVRNPYLKVRRTPLLIATLFVILTSSLAILCRYYPWKLPVSEGSAFAASARGVNN